MGLSGGLADNGGLSLGELPASVVTRSWLPINVKDVQYGATGDGVTDDTTAINAALAAIPGTGGSVFFPPGNYLVSGDQLVVNTSNVEVYGTGPSTIITQKAGTTFHNVLRANTTGGRLSNITFRDLTVDGNGGQNVGAAGGIRGLVCAYQVDGITVRNCRVRNGRDYCIQVLGCSAVKVADNRVDTCYAQDACNPIDVTSTTSEVEIRGNIVKHTATVAVASASHSGTTATFTTSSPHLININGGVGQYVKVTGCSVNDYNGYWSVVSTPTPTTFTVALNTTPAGNATGGTVQIMADRNIFCASNGGTNVIVASNISLGASACVEAELASGLLQKFVMFGNVVDDFINHGIGAYNTSGSPTVYGRYGSVNNNEVWGRDGTAEFGMAGAGSTFGLLLQGSYLEASHNVISNVREGIDIGYAGNIEEDGLAAESNTITLAADATGCGIKISKGGVANPIRRLRLRNNTIDGLLSTTSLYGIQLDGNVQDFSIGGNLVRGMGRSGVYLQTSSAIGPSYGGISGDNKVIDCFCGASGNLQDQVGFAIGGSSTAVDVFGCWAYDTRTPKVQKYGLAILSGATVIRALHNHFENNLTGEVNDATSGVGLVVQDARDPLGLGFALTSDPRLSGAPGGIGANNRILYARVIAGGGLCQHVGVYVGTVDSGAPTAPTGTRQVNTTGVWGGTGIVRAKVVAVNANGESVASAEASATLIATTDTILWAWTAPTGVTGITTYHVYRTAVGGAAGTEAGYIDIGSAAVSYVDTGSALTGSSAPPASNATGSDQIGVAVYSSSGVGRSAVPAATRKGASASFTPTASALNQVALTAAVQVNIGDWLAVGVAGVNTQIAKNAPTAGALNTALSGFQDGLASPIPPSTPAMAASGTTLCADLIAYA